MFKKLSAAAALAFMATVSTAAYASGIGAAVDGVVNGAEDIADGVVNAGEDVADGIIGTDGDPAGSGTNDNFDGLNSDGKDDGSPSGSGSEGKDLIKDNAGSTDMDDNADLTESTPDTSDTTGESGTTTDKITNDAKNPNTGISLGFVASTAVLAAMGVTLTTVRRKND